MGKVIARQPKRRPRWIPFSTTWRRSDCLVCLLTLVSALSFAQTSKPTESQVEAAYLYNFGKFVTWPADPAAKTDSFGICLLGRDPFGSILDEIVNGEKIDGKKIGIHRISRIQDASTCKVLFVSSSEESRLPAIFTEAQRMHLLTVSDMPRFIERGGTIGLVIHEDRVRFEVNRSRAEESHLALSSELLKVAAKVIGGK